MASSGGFGVEAKRTVLFVAPSIHPLGGVPTWLGYLLPGLRRRGWSPALALTKGRFHDPSAYLAAHPYDPWVAIENPTGSREGRVRAIASAILSVSPQLVVAANIVDALPAVARCKARGWHGRFVLAIHSFLEGFLEDIRLAPGLFDAVGVTNRLAQAWIQRSGVIPGSSVHYAPCGVVLGESPAGSDEGGLLNLLWVGRLDDDEKRVSDLIGIVESLHRRGAQFQLDIVGTGPAERGLRQALAPYGEQVQFAGFVKPEQLRERHYRPGRILLITSEAETGPMVAWEAMAAGVAIVSSRYVGSGMEHALVEGKSCLMFPVGAVDAAASALIELRKIGPRRKLCAAGFEVVRQRYSREASISAWERVLTNALDSPAGGVQEFPEISKSGRLDRWLGVSMAETLRKATGIRHTHNDPGGEWPHSCGSSGSRKEFLSMLRKLDVAE